MLKPNDEDFFLSFGSFVFKKTPCSQSESKNCVFCYCCNKTTNLSGKFITTIGDVDKFWVDLGTESKELKSRPTGTSMNFCFLTRSCPL